MLIELAVWLPWVISVGLLLLLPLVRMRALIVLVGVYAVTSALLGLMAAAGLAWLLKDGLGPDMVQSHGLLAWTRFWEFFWPALVAGLVVGAATVGACRWRLRASGGPDV